eukprot:m.169193 g.169193  ORF g.169193 m.169193 type:complete len:413 (+) comp18234_c0_seq1:312-1550(+)
MILGNIVNGKGSVLPEPSIAPNIGFRRKRESTFLTHQASEVGYVHTCLTWILIGVSGFFLFLLWYASYSDQWGVHCSQQQQNTSNETVVISSGLSLDKAWTAAKWDHGIVLAVKSYSVLFESTSKFQDILVINNKALGPVLLLDGIPQTSSKDEAGYHEMIVHVPMSFLRKSSDEGRTSLRALVIGGGDGGSARELLRHPSVEEVVLCEIDPAVSQASKDWMETIWVHPYLEGLPLDADKRLRIVNEDAIEFLKTSVKYGELFDVIVVDASDPVGPGVALYQPSFYELLSSALRPGGAVSVQAGSWLYFKECFLIVYHRLRASFPTVRPYTCITQLYPGGFWNLMIATKSGEDPSSSVCTASSRDGNVGVPPRANHGGTCCLHQRCEPELSVSSVQIMGRGDGCLSWMCAIQ